MTCFSNILKNFHFISIIFKVNKEIYIHFSSNAKIMHATWTSTNQTISFNMYWYVKWFKRFWKKCTIKLSTAHIANHIRLIVCPVTMLGGQITTVIVTNCGFIPWILFLATFYFHYWNHAIFDWFKNACVIYII